MRQLLFPGVLLLTFAVAVPVTPAAAAPPEIAIVSPANGATIEGSEVQVQLKIDSLQLKPTTVPVAEAGMHADANHPGEGHIHARLDLEPLVVWTGPGPFTLSNV